MSKICKRLTNPPIIKAHAIERVTIPSGGTMAEDNEVKPGLPSKIRSADALITLVAAVVGVWGTWTTITLNKLSNQLSIIKEERGWSEKIFDKYSDLVTRDGLSPDQRIAALNGLLTLTNLVAEDQARVRDELRKTIGDQAQFYSTTLQQQSLAQTGAEKEKSTALAEAAAAVSNRAANQLKESAHSAEAIKPKPTALEGHAASKWKGYNVEVFWCEKSPDALTTAQAIVALKLLDKSETGWHWFRSSAMLAANIQSRFYPAASALRLLGQ
jgi:hypothetical protein